MTGASAVGKYADAIMAMIREDIADGTIPATVASFTDLHDYVDANDYLVDAPMPRCDADRDLLDAVTVEVSRRLSTDGTA